VATEAKIKISKINCELKFIINHQLKLRETHGTFISGEWMNILSSPIEIDIAKEAPKARLRNGRESL